MNEFFGIDMTWIMLALLGLLAVSLATVGWVFLRNRVMFMIGVRNIPRRRAQTTLIIIGLMLSTLIISAAFAIGDTADYSITNSAYQRLHSVDEIVQVQSGGDDDDGESFFEGESLISAAPIEQARADELVQRFRGIDGVDGAVAVIRGPAAASNLARGQTEPLVLLMGVNPSQLDGGFESDLQTVSGESADLTALPEGAIYLNESAADELDARPGDTVTLYAQNQPYEFTIAGVLVDRVLSGALSIDSGFVLPLDRAQELLGRPGEVDFILVSNEGGTRDGLDRSEEVMRRVESALLGSPLRASDVKQQLVDDAAEISSGIVTIFVVLGLFSIAAGMLLIFLIFVMLAAERRTEMGMSRAVGTKRLHLVQIFMSEGMVYNIGAAAVGCALGVVVSIGIVQVLARLFDEFGLNITFNVTVRSIVVSYCIGVVLTFLTVTFSAWRIGNINIVAAIRDTPEPVQGEKPPVRTTLIPTVFRYLYWLVFKPRGREWLRSALLLVAAVAGLAASAALASGDPATWLQVIAVLVQIAAVLVAVWFLFATFHMGSFLAVGGIALMLVGLGTDQGFFFGFGWSALIFGLAVVLAQLRFPQRPIYTAAGVILLVSWLLLAGGNTPFERVNGMDGGAEIFFLSGVSMVLAATFVIVYNADLLLHLLNWMGSAVSTLVPSIRTAVAYPLANKFRTGMTIAMISLVMFALVMMSTMNENFGQIFNSDEAIGPYAVVAIENPGNPIPDLAGTLQQEGFDTTPLAGDGNGPDGDDGIDPVYQANRSIAEVSQVSNLNEEGAQDWSGYPVLGMSDDFVRNARFTLQQRATGFESDDAVWDALAEDPDYALVDAFAIPQGGFGGPGAIVEGLEPTDETFEPIPFLVRDSATGTIKRVYVIGVLSTQSSGLFSGFWISNEAFNEVFERPELTQYLIRLDDRSQANEVARQIESTLIERGVQADSLRKIIQDFQDQQQGFLYLIQGFMGIGLFVGIAAVGVIAFRTVVERRQQIGMLRAIGYSRRAVALSFLMESSFTALLGIVSGIALALLLAYQLVNTDDFVPGGVDGFYIPWVQIILIGTFAFLASIVMTIVPSRQASSIPIAEALRYE
ncbi:MAG TPA: FtsX-like permease family protein [Dehalococcoidia bacterium]|nr:FtsX-like permease family protein [Dehalococcoidia bacterium]